MSMFAEATRRAAQARFKQKSVDSEGQEIEVITDNHYIINHTSFFQYDVREDEEQNVKLAESIDLLLAAGYFRARIKGLTPFDKVRMDHVIVSYESPDDHMMLLDCWRNDMVYSDMCI